MYFNATIVDQLLICSYILDPYNRIHLLSVFLQKIAHDSSVVYELDKENEDVMVVTSKVGEGEEEVMAIRRFRRQNQEEVARRISVI